jgi:hypothetical protein
MKRVLNSNEQRLINDVSQKMREALKGFIGTDDAGLDAVTPILQKLLNKVLDDVDEYEPIVGPILPRSNDGNSTKFKQKSSV